MKEEVLENGFLNVGVMKQIKIVRNENKDIFDLIYAFNKLAYKVSDEFKDKPCNKKENYIFCAFVELHKFYQSSIILLERGLYESSQSLMRSILELSFKIIMVIESEDYISSMAYDLIVEDIKLLNHINRNKLYELVPEEKIDEILEDRQKRKEELREKGIKPILNACDLCKKISCNKEYTYYKLLSNYTHTNLMSIYNLLIPLNEGVYINGGFKYDSFKEDTIRLIECFCLGMNRVIIYLNNNSLLNDYNELIGNEKLN